MQIFKTKTNATLITIILILGLFIPFLEIQTASAAFDNATSTAIAQGMKWDFPNAANYNASATRLVVWNRYHDQVPTRTYNVIAPNPVGVGQEFTVVYFQPIVPADALLTNDIRYEYYHIITKPDGSSVRYPESGIILSDSTGTNFFTYIPDQIGNYSVTTIFTSILYRWYSSSTQRNFYGITLKESNYTTTVVVQSEPVTKIGFTITPLPTEYWARPIEGQNTDWNQVSSNWYGNSRDESYGGPNNRFQRDGTAPNSGHIVWTRPTEDQGLIGGQSMFSVPGEVFNAGHQYQPRFQSQIILNGRLYFSPNLYWSGNSELLDAVDLRTGQLLWETNTTGVGQPDFGYYYDFDSPNQHGVTTPGWLFTNNFARAYQPARGIVSGLNITGVPSGFDLVDNKGETLRYVLDNAGNSTNPSYRLIQWNSSRVLTDGVMSAIISGTINASLTSTTPRFDWNISAPWRNNMPNTPTIRSVIEGDIMLLSNGSAPQGTGSPSYAYSENSTWFAISLKPETRGNLLWMKTINQVDTQTNDMLSYQRAAEGVFVFVTMPTLKFTGYSMYTGEKLWETEELSNLNPFGYFSYPSLMYDESTTIAYGKLFVGGYLGHVIAFDLYNGTKLWTYAAPTDASVFKYYTLMLGAVADNKLFVGTHEHSADTPLFKGNRLRVLDVNTGNPIFTMESWPHPRSMAIADGTLIYWNNYDGQIYALAKGPTKMTVNAPDTAATLGATINIKGTITDISAGTNQKEQAARFPTGVPAVSDESQSQWMEYVYMQKARPTNATGVPIALSVVDANGNFREIGTTTSNDGFFSFNYKPDIEGQYTVYAAFTGSESYWPTHAVTSFTVDPAPATPAPTAEPIKSNVDQYFVPAVVGIIIAIAIGFALTIVVLRKRP